MVTVELVGTTCWDGVSHAEGGGNDLEALGLLLLRTESVASSKIEAVEASVDDYARALHGVRANSSAVSMVAATTALDVMIHGVAHTGRIELTALTSAHESLMRDEPGEAAFAGRLRDMQNWIGGSDHSPRGAFYVPPPPETVPGYLDDLVAFANRDDLPALVQAAIAHAQFESIHLFTEGNGRIGRDSSTPSCVEVAPRHVSSSRWPRLSSPTATATSIC